MSPKIIIFLLLIIAVTSTVVSLNGGQLTITGTVTSYLMDIRVTYQANVQWLGIIFSPDEVSADVHILQLNSSNSATPVSVLDCYLDQNSYFQVDNVNNIQPSASGLQASMANGIFVTYSRDLYTGDPQDTTLYANQMTRLCFVSSTVAFVGNGSESNMNKVCSYFSTHKNIVNASQDRLVGNFANTTTFNGNNLTVYLTQNTDNYSTEQWLFATVINQQQGLATFVPAWIGVYYTSNVSASRDMALIQYNYDVTVNDLYFPNTLSTPALDTSFASQQGSSDVIKVLGGIDINNYLVTSFKRKFSTGDVYRDTVIDSSLSTMCLAAGVTTYSNSTPIVQMSAPYTQSDYQCIQVGVQDLYSSIFRATNTTSNTSSNVAVIITADGLPVGRSYETNLLIMAAILMMLQ